MTAAAGKHFIISDWNERILYVPSLSFIEMIWNWPSRKWDFHHTIRSNDKPKEMLVTTKLYLCVSAMRLRMSSLQPMLPWVLLVNQCCDQDKIKTSFQEIENVF